MFAWEDKDGRSMDIGDIDTREPDFDKCIYCGKGRMIYDGKSREEDGIEYFYHCDKCETEIVTKGAK